MEEEITIPKRFQITCYDEFDPISLNLIDLHHSSVERQKGLQKISDRNDEEIDNRSKSNRKSGKFFNKEFHQTISGILPLDGLVSKKTKESNPKDNLRDMMQSLDNISHWICKFSSIESNNVSWFINNETTLYVGRLVAGLGNRGSKFSEAELAENLVQILNIFYVENGYYLKYTDNKDNFVEVGDHTIAKIVVPFEDAIPLLKNHKVEMKAGFVYVPKEWKTLVYLVGGLFKRNLWNDIRTIEDTFRVEEIEDTRLSTLISNLPDMVISTEMNVNFENISSLENSNITADKLTMLANRNFPLCMSEMHQHLRTKKTLKHFGRIQYGLFLKSAGVSNKDSKNVFKSFFNQKGITSSKMNEYMYYIDHMYGLKGKKTSYSAWSCGKIIGKIPGSGDIYGCPFKYYGKSQLKTAMRRQIGDEGKINDIMRELEPTNGTQKNIKGACQKHFQVRHGGMFVESIGIHPNIYFRRSFDYYTDKKPVARNGMSSKENREKQGKSAKKMEIEYEKEKGGKSNISNLT